MTLQENPESEAKVLFSYYCSCCYCMYFDMVVATIATATATTTTTDRKIHSQLFERIDWQSNLLMAERWEKIMGYLIFFYSYY